MVIIYEPDARNPNKNNPLEVNCPVCGNAILYRLGDTEASQGHVHRKCPVCKQESEYQVPPEIRAQARKHFEDSVPPEIREAAQSWFNRKQKSTERMRKKRAQDPDYGQIKKGA